MDICHLKNAELEHQKYKGRVVLRGDIVKDDSGSYAVFTEQRSSSSHQWLPLCLGRQARRVKHGETRGKTNEFKSKLACILDASESTRLRMEESLPNYHEDHIAGEEDNSLQH